MIAFIKLWIVAIILFENYFFMTFFESLTRMVRNSYEEEGVEIVDRKLYLTIFSMIRVAKAMKVETTYQSLIHYGVSLFYSPFFLVLYIWWMEL
jgi:hypothetical protein